MRIRTRAYDKACARSRIRTLRIRLLRPQVANDQIPGMPTNPGSALMRSIQLRIAR